MARELRIDLVMGALAVALALTPHGGLAPVSGWPQPWMWLGTLKLAVAAADRPVAARGRSHPSARARSRGAGSRAGVCACAAARGRPGRRQPDRVRFFRSGGLASRRAGRARCARALVEGARQHARSPEFLWPRRPSTAGGRSRLDRFHCAPLCPESGVGVAIRCLVPRRRHLPTRCRRLASGRSLLRRHPARLLLGVSSRIGNVGRRRRHDAVRRGSRLEPGRRLRHRALAGPPDALALFEPCAKRRPAARTLCRQSARLVVLAGSRRDRQRARHRRVGRAPGRGGTIPTLEALSWGLPTPQRRLLWRQVSHRYRVEPGLCGILGSSCGR